MRHLILIAIITLTYLQAQPPILSSQMSEELRNQKQTSYQENLRLLEIFRKTNASAFAQANSTQKKQILSKVRKRLENDLANHIFPAWYGTPWAFHGVSKEPGKGKIACGYFVSTCLTQMGFRAPRIKLAQQASQKIIKTFTPKTHYKVMVDKSMNSVREHLKKTGNGIYIVGLDHHVGFVSVHENQMTFIHSSYYRPEKKVKAEPIDSHNPLRNSNYRVFGKLFSNSMLRKWLLGERFRIK